MRIFFIWYKKGMICIQRFQYDYIAVEILFISVWYQFANIQSPISFKGEMCVACLKFEAWISPYMLRIYSFICIKVFWNAKSSGHSNHWGYSKEFLDRFGGHKSQTCSQLKLIKATNRFNLLYSQFTKASKRYNWYPKSCKHTPFHRKLFNHCPWVWHFVAK